MRHSSLDCPIPSAVVPVAGLGTRMLPLTKAIPKEMLPVGRKPVIQHVAEELARSGVRNVLFVTAGGKSAIENHFDPDPALRKALRDSGKRDLLDEMGFEELGLNVQYVLQSAPRGLGDAILHGESFSGGQPFLVALGDSILGLRGDSTVCRRMAAAFVERNAQVVIAVEEVPEERVRRYGIVDPLEDGEVFRVRSIVEKPRPEDAPSRWAVAGRYAFSSRIFDIIRGEGADGSGEVQITDAIRRVAEQGGTVLGVRLRPEERRFDIGSMSAYFETFIEFALADPSCGRMARSRLARALRPGASRVEG